MMNQNDDYLREVEALFLTWTKELQRKRESYRSDALLNLSHFIQDGLHGIGERWAAEAEERRQAIPSLPAFPDRKIFLEIIQAANDYQVAVAMCSVANKMMWKTYEGVDKTWLGIVGGSADDASNYNVAVAMLLNEEVKLRQAADFLPGYHCLLAEEEEKKAQRHLVAFVRSHLTLSPRRDLWQAVKRSSAHLDPRKALLLELRGELAEPLADLTPRTLRMLPSRAAYRIRKRLTTPENETDAFFNLEAAATKAPGVEEVVEEEHFQELFRDAIDEIGLTDCQAEIFTLKRRDKLKLKDIALKLGKPIGTVSSHWHRAKAAVKKFEQSKNKNTD